MKISYYAVFNYDEYDENEEEYGIAISFPDVPEAISCARNEKEGVEFAMEVLQLVMVDSDNSGDPMWRAVSDMPKSTLLEDLELKENEKAFLIEFDTQDVDLKDFTWRGHIEKRLCSESWYTISPFHCQYEEERGFSELENYLLENYIDVFADKISVIILKLICLYMAYIEVTDTGGEEQAVLEGIERNRDIRDEGLKKIAEIVRCVILEAGVGYVHIYFMDFNSLIQIGNGFHVSVYTQDQELLKSVESLVKMEGLSIWMVEDGGKPTYHFDEIG